MAATRATPAAVSAPEHFKPEKEYPDDAQCVEGFLQLNPGFLLPYLVTGIGLHALQYVPQACAYFEANDMQVWGFMSALQYALTMIVLAFGMHGFIAVYYDKLLEQGLKLQEAKTYHFNQQQVATRFMVIMGTQVCVYSFLPIRAGSSGWQGALEFFIGLSILNIAGDAWFFVVHSICHKPGFYEFFHKTHHRNRTPTPFASYYISQWAHLVQEHLLTVPLMLFCPIPLSAWLYYQYVGTFGAMLQHSNFVLTKLQVCPFLPITVGQVFTFFNPWVFVLGAHTTEQHDDHHENFHGNFQLSYTYLDRLCGTYSNPAVSAALTEPLAPAASAQP